MPTIEPGYPDAPAPRELGLTAFIDSADMVDILTTQIAQFKQTHRCYPDLINASNSLRAPTVVAFMKRGAPAAIASENPLYFGVGVLAGIADLRIPIIFTAVLKDEVQLVLTNRQRQINEVL